MDTVLSTVLHDFTANNPIEFTSEAIAARLEKDGYILADRHYHYVKLAPTKDMLDNKARYETLRKAGEAELNKVTDSIYLGSDKDALDVLASFQETLKGLIK